MVTRASFAAPGLVALSWCVLSVAWVAGCEPELREGVYGCMTGQCPDGWYCHTDQLCYREAQQDGSMTNKLFDPEALGEPCDDGGACKPGICAFGPDPTSTHGYCSAACDADEDCPMFGNLQGACVGGECLMPCSEASDCASPLRCHEAALGMMSGARACFEVPDLKLHGGTGCEGSPEGGTCPQPGYCVASPPSVGNNDGVCSLRCSSGTECPGDGICVNVAGMINHCMLPCRTNNDCDDLVCNHDFGPNSVCTPQSWIGLQPPLQVGDMPGGGAGGMMMSLPMP